MPVGDITLHQFHASHYNDKARWALAHKGIAYRRETLLPGPHQGAMRKLSGQTATPVLELDGNVIAGSAAIIDALEQRYPAKPLYPADATARAEALAIQTRFDAEVGPATRTVAFTVLVQELGYVSRLFGANASPLARAIYRGALVLVKPLMAKANGVTDPANVQRAFDITRKTFDWVADATRGREYLVGESFSVADLTVAALLTPVMRVDHPDLLAIGDVPPALERLTAEWHAHPASEWVRRRYAQDRPAA